MDEIFRSPIVIWTIRAVLVIVLVVSAWMITLHFARYLRPKHIRRLVTADLTEFKGVGGKLTLFGQEMHATLETARDQEIRALDRRMALLEDQMRDVEQFGGRGLSDDHDEEESND